MRRAIPWAARRPHRYLAALSGATALLLALPAVSHASSFGAVPAVRDTAREWHDLAYASGSPAQKLDLYLPATGDGPFPLIVWVHGGGWQKGDKRFKPDAPQLRVLDRGYALASVNYRLSAEAIFPAQIHDVKAAVRWLRAHAAEYGIDPERIGAWGSSAGGHLVALLGTTAGVEALEGEALGNAGTSSRVAAVVDWFGPSELLRLDEQLARLHCEPFAGKGHDDAGSPTSRLIGHALQTRPDLSRAASPVTYVSPDDPPFLIQHGKADCSVHYLQSQRLYDLLAETIGPDRVGLTLKEGVGHGQSGFSDAANMALVLDFFDHHLKDPS